jgi:hypothetical protein
MYEVNLRDMIVFGKAMNEAIVDVNRTCDLKKSKSMAKNAEGSIRLTIKIMFSESDCKKLYPQVGALAWFAWGPFPARHCGTFVLVPLFRLSLTLPRQPSIAL